MILEPAFEPAVNATESCWLDAVMLFIVGAPGAASAIVKVNELVDPVAPFESVIVAITVKVPFEVGVPEILHLFAL